MSLDQTYAFHDGEGDKWFERNRARLERAENDPVLNTLRTCDIRPARVLEVGCANGWRLNELMNRYDCSCHGIEPSRAALADGCARFPGVVLHNGDATELDTFTAPVDLLIFGFCLYLCDRECLWRIIEATHNILAENGHLVIWDFPDTWPSSRVYKHNPSLRSYKMDYAQLWLANPQYVLVDRQEFGEGDDATAVTVLCKRSVEQAWPLRD